MRDGGVARPGRGVPPLSVPAVPGPDEKRDGGYRSRRALAPLLKCLACAGRGTVA